MQRSKSYFLHASSEEIGADIEESKDSGGVKREKSIVKISEPERRVCLSLGCGLGRFLRGYLKHGAKVVVGLEQTDTT